MTVTPAEARRLENRLGGHAVHRDERAYAELAESRFPNPEVEWTPDLVVRCAGTADVMAAVGFAAEHGLGVAIRGGGVGWCGAGPGTLLLDLRGLDGVWVDPGRAVVRAQGGAIWREVNRELAPFDLAAAGPQFPGLGIAGHVLGGGHGWLSSKLGWASDTLRAVDLVTADGRLVRASAEEEPDLFWALRGAGHNFGVAVSLELDLMPLREVTHGVVWWHPEHTAEALDLFRSWVVRAPDEVTTILAVGHPPAAWPGPAKLRGRPAVHALVCHCGPAEQAERDLAELRAHPAVVADTVRRVPWPAVTLAPSQHASGVHRRSRTQYLTGMSDEVLAITARRAGEVAPLSLLGVHYYGGGIQRVDEQATAMSHRDKPWNYTVTTTWPSMQDGAPVRGWQDEWVAELEPHTHPAFYVNYLFDQPEDVSRAYNPAAWARLRALKHRWDPGNLFATNQNIPPAGSDQP